MKKRFEESTALNRMGKVKPKEIDRVDLGEKLAQNVATIDKFLDGAVSAASHPKYNFTCLRLERGPFAGTIWAYGKVELIDSDDNGVNVTFDYQVFGGPEFDDNKKREFEHYISKILTHILVITMDPKANPKDFWPDIDLG